MAAGFEWLFRGFDLRVLEFVAERGKASVASVVDGENCSATGDAAGRSDLRHLLHGNVEDFGICDTKDFHVEKFAEGPASVIVGSFLRIVRRPKLIVEERVGDAGVGLVHTNDVAAGGEIDGG